MELSQNLHWEEEVVVISGVETNSNFCPDFPYYHAPSDFLLSPASLELVLIQLVQASHLPGL